MAFRNTLGVTNHGVLHGTGNVFDSGRRGDQLGWRLPTPAVPRNLMLNFFNANSPRGVGLTPGSGFEISATAI